MTPNERQRIDKRRKQYRAIAVVITLAMVIYFLR